jgi:outer membrane protein
MMQSKYLASALCMAALVLSPSAARCATAPAKDTQSKAAAANTAAVGDAERLAQKALKRGKHDIPKAPAGLDFALPVSNGAPMPTSLADLIVSALNSNLELQAKRLDPAVEKLRITEAWGAFDPNFTANQLVTHDQHPQNQIEFLSTGQVSYLYEEDIQHYEAGFTGLTPIGTQWLVDTVSERADNTFNRQSNSIFHPEYTTQSKLQITQPLLKNFGFGANLADVRLSKSAYAKSREDYRAVVIKTIADVMDAYYELVFGQENLKVKQEAVTLAQNLVKENTRRYDEGKMAPIDVTDARERLSEAQEEEVLAENFLEHRRATLRELTRENYESVSQDPNWNVDPADLAREAPPLSRGGLILQMFENNPAYLSAMQVVNEANVRLAYAKNQRYPSVDLKGSIGWNGLSGDWGPSFTDYRNRPGPDYTAGVSVTIPLLGRTERARVSEARIRKAQALLSVKQSENQLLAAFDTAMRDIDAARNRIKLVHESVVLAEQAFRSEERRLESGLTTSYNVSLSQKDLSQARSRELATYVDLNKALVQLYVLVGTLPERQHVNVKFD